MKELKEKRMTERYPFDASIRFAYFNQRNFHPARLLGFSEDGISFNSKTPIKTGTTILIKLDPFSKNTQIEKEKRGLKTISLVEIRWCREIDCRYGSEYEIGAKFFMCD